MTRPGDETNFFQSLNMLDDLLCSEDQRREIERVRATFCAAFGHRPEQDQCGKPEHDFCLTCGKGLPGEAHK